MSPKNPDEQFLTTFTSATADIHYKERPVSIREFISNERFLGKLTKKDSIPGKAIYPRWKRELSFLMEEPTKYIPVLTGAIGIGKSRAAIIGIAYIMYLHLCMKDAFGYYGKAAGGKMAIVFFNLNKSLGKSKGFRILQNYLLSSEWFCERGRISGDNEDSKVIYFPLFEYILASPYAQAELGQDIIAALMDEVDSPKAGLAIKERVIKSVDSALTRFEDRFVARGQSLGKFFIVASKQEKDAFINAFITKKKTHKAVHIVEFPKWEADETEFKDCKKFPVLIGDIYSPSKILDSDDDVREALSNGFDIIQVPEQFRRAFQEDIIGALRDLAGISADYLRKNKLFKSEKYLLDCYDSSKEDPVKIVTVYLGIKDTEKELIHFLDINKIRIDRFIPRYIHGDLGFTGDSYGIAMSCISGWKELSTTLEDGSIAIDKYPVVETDFILRIKAPENDEIDFMKVRKFIVDLKKIHGFNIQLCTFDMREASFDTSQILEKAGIPCEYKSIDKNPQWYRSFRDDLVKQSRWVCHRHEYLHFELVNLEDDTNANKVDHPKEVEQMTFLDDGSTNEVVIKGSKDCADATVVSVQMAIDKCILPPDIEIIRKGLGLKEKPKHTNELWWVDEGSLTHKTKKAQEEKKEENVKKDLASTYKDIFKRSQGRL